MSNPGLSFCICSSHLIKLLLGNIRLLNVKVKVLSRAQWRIGRRPSRFYSPRPPVYKCSESCIGGLVHWLLREFNFPIPFSYVERQTRRQWVTILKVFGMTRPGLEPTTYRLWGRRSTTGPSLLWLLNVQSIKLALELLHHYQIIEFITRYVCSYHISFLK